MTTAYLVCGPESSGNRLLAAILSRSGCAGEGSTNQPDDQHDLPISTQPLVLVKHDSLPTWIDGLRRAGYLRIVAIIVVREPLANCKSMVERGHQPDFETAYKHRTQTIAENIVDCFDSGVELEIVTYEGLSEPFLATWLPRIGLPYKCGSILLPGQPLTEIANQNGKHY